MDFEGSSASPRTSQLIPAFVVTSAAARTVPWHTEQASWLNEDITIRPEFNFFAANVPVPYVNQGVLGRRLELTCQNRVGVC